MFERTAVEDREKSVESGRFVAKDIDYAIITPMGSKDRIPRLVHEWFPYLEEQVRQERFPGAWLDAYKKAYERWKTDQQAPDEGTSILHWPPASPAMVKNMLQWNVRTVEDLAAANEETLGRLGMGARDLKRRAVEWLASASAIGKSSEQTSALKAQIEAQEAQNAALRETVSLLQAQVTALQNMGGQVPQPIVDDASELFDATPTAVPKGARPL